MQQTPRLELKNLTLVSYRDACLKSQPSGGRGRQISEIKVSLVYRVSCRTAKSTQKKTCLEKQTNMLKENQIGVGVRDMVMIKVGDILENRRVSFFLGFPLSLSVPAQH